MLGWVSRKESRDNALRTLRANQVTNEELDDSRREEKE